MSTVDPSQISSIVRRALDEDVGRGDVTSAWTLPPGLVGHGVFLSKATGILAGLAVAREVFNQVSLEVRLEILKTDGESI